MIPFGAEIIVFARVYKGFWHFGIHFASSEEWDGGGWRDMDFISFFFFFSVPFGTLFWDGLRVPKGKGKDKRKGNQQMGKEKRKRNPILAPAARRPPPYP